MVNKNTKPFNIRTDLAIECCEIVKEQKNDYSDGIEIKTEELETLTVTDIFIKNKYASKLFHKPIGRFVTIETDKMQINDVSCHEKIIEVFSKYLKQLIKLKKGDSVLVTGLGNWNITPDALGPQTVSKILVTRHLDGVLPEELGDNIKPVAAISPGVMGITGVETAEIIKGIADRVKPSLIIAVDALAARKSSRINTTIQMTDTGVSPGSGVGNKRSILNEDSLGVPVIAIGVPTVIDAATIVSDSIDRIIDEMKDYAEENDKAFYETVSSLKNEEKYSLIKSLLEPCDENMIVTPKDVDEVIKRLSGIIANGINIALQESLDKEDINRFMNI